MTSRIATEESICDLTGEPLRPDAAILLKALDKLLTVGAYYSSEHDQYLKASRKACDAIVGVIGGKRKHAAIELTAQGLMVGGQNLDPHHRNVRLLHELLVPLNIARLEIAGSLTPEELRQAVTALQEHKLLLGQSNSFQEIVIENLPPTVRTISCSVLRRSRGEGGGGAKISLDDLLGKWQNTTAIDCPEEAADESERLARRFMDLVAQVLTNLETVASEPEFETRGNARGAVVNPSDLEDLKIAVQRLAEVNPDPAELAKLITQAQKALDLSRDSRSVDLAFRVLKKGIAVTSAAKASPGKRPPKPTKFKLSVDQLLAAAAGLEADAPEVGDPRIESLANELGIGLYLLRTNPAQSLRASLTAIVERALIHPDAAARHLRLCARAVDTAARQDGSTGVDELLPLLTEILRRSHVQLLAPFWADLLELCAADHLGELWPHLVNDILLGFGDAPPETVAELAIAAGQISLLDAVKLGARLEKIPALKKRKAARDIFTVPLPRVYPVIATLMSTPLRKWLSHEIHKSLWIKPPSTRVAVLIRSLGDYRPENVVFYLDLIRHGEEEHLPRKVQEKAAGILYRALNDLTPKQRRAKWVARGLAELWKLDQDIARLTSERVLGERKFWFLKAWPAAVRKVAAQALNNQAQEVT